MSELSYESLSNFVNKGQAVDYTINILEQWGGGGGGGVIWSPYITQTI